MAGDVGAYGEGEPQFPIGANLNLVYQQQDASGHRSLVAMDPNTPASATNVSVPSLPGDEIAAPDWSPSGNWLLFTSSSTQLYVFNAFDGRTLPVVDGTDAPVAGFNPQWATDNRISFSSFTVYENSVSNLDIFVGNLQFEPNFARLTNSLNLTYDPSADFRHAWSPDGSKFVFESSRSGAGDLYLMDFTDFDGTTLPTKVNLTVGQSTSNDSDPEFSPDGRLIAYRSSITNSDIWVMHSDGSSPQRLTTDLSDEESPTWSPDGTKLVYSARSFSAGQFQEHLRMMDADGTHTVQLTSASGSQSLPTWRQPTPAPSDVAVEINMPSASAEDQTFEVQIVAHSLGVVDAEQLTIRVLVDSRMAIDGIADGTRVGDDVEFHVDRLAVGDVFQRTLIVRAFHAGTGLRAEVVAILAADNDPEASNNENSDAINIAPRNDDFSKATVISGLSDSRPIANFNATKQSNILGSPEPSHAVDANEGLPIAGGSSIWYAWTANNAGSVTFTNKGSRFDTIMAAYFIVGGNSLQRVASSDDGDGTSARITFNSLEGETYYIAVDGYNGAQGAGYLSWSATVAEPITTPQEIHGVQPTNVLLGSPATTVTITGNGFSDQSRVYVLANHESPDTAQLTSRNFLPTIVRSSTELQAEIPARMLQSIGPFKLVVVRGNEFSNSQIFYTSLKLPELSGFKIALGQLSISASLIEQLAKKIAEGEDQIDTYSLQGNVRINDYLAVEGASVVVEVNKTTNALRVRIREGSIQLTNVPHYNTITLWSGSNFEFKIDGDGMLSDLLRATIETPLRDKGLDVSVDHAHLLLGTTNDSQGRPVYGIELFGSLRFLEIPGLLGTPLHFDKLVLTQNDGMRFSGEVGPINLTVGGLLKLEDVFLKFEAGRTPQEDAFSGRAKISTDFFSASGSIGIRNGTIESLSGDLDIPAFTGLPLGLLNITGGTLDVQNLINLRNLQVRVGANATIAHPAVSNILRLQDVGVFYRLPGAFGGGGSLDIFKVPAVEAAIDLDFSAQKYTFGGKVELITSFPVFDVQGELSANLSASGMKVSGYLQGDVQIPDGDNGLYRVLKSCKEAFGFRVGPCLTFPMQIASARLAYQNNQFSFTTSLPIIGQVALRVKQTQGAVQAVVDLFHNLPAVPTHFVFGGGGEGELPTNAIGTYNMPVGSPRMIVSVNKPGDLPLYDLVDPLGNVYTSEQIGAIGGQFFQNEATGNSIYVVENPMAGEWTAVAHPGVTGSLEFEVWGANAAPELSNLTVQSLGNDYQIDFQALDADDDPRVSLYYTTSPTLTNGTLIAEGLSASQVQSFVWNVSDGSVPSGKYYIYAIAEDDLNTPAIMFTANAVEVIDPLAPSQVTILQLSAVENAIDVQWDSVSAPDLAGYQVWYGLDLGANTVFDHKVDAGNQLSLRLVGLTSNTTYRITVVAYDRTTEPDPLNPGQMATRSRFGVPAIAQSYATDQASPPSVSFLPFSQGAKLKAGSILTLNWAVQENVALEKQQLFYSQDNGVTYTLLAQYGADVRQANWPVPADLAISHVKFRILAEDTSGNSATDETDLSYRSVPAGTFSLSSDAISVTEGTKYASVKIVRTDGFNGSVSLHYDTNTQSSAGWAEATSDYAGFFGEVTFEDGIKEQTLFIPIVDDSQVEGVETFKVRLSSPTGGAQLSGITSATISITDNDVVRDSDGDGIDDTVEARVGDGNQDGIADSTQANVASYFDSVTGRMLTLASGSGTTLGAVQAWTGQAVPAFANAFLGGVTLTVSGVGNGQIVPIQIHSTALAIDTVLIHGISAKDPIAHWYYFTDNGTTGVRFNTDKQANVLVKDGGRGDHDQQANSSIQIVLGIGLSSHTSKYFNMITDLDVSGDESITALDALMIINELNSKGSHKLSAPLLPIAIGFEFLDTSSDGFVTAFDALLVINYLNTHVSSEGEQASNSPQDSAFDEFDIDTFSVDRSAGMVESLFGDFDWAIDGRRRNRGASPSSSVR